MNDCRPKKGRVWLVKANALPDACAQCVALVVEEKYREGIQSKEYIPYYRLEMKCDHRDAATHGKFIFRSVYADIPKAEAPHAETLGS